MSDLPVEIKTLSDFPAVSEPIEDAETIAGNAIKKARHYFKATALFTLADDTGLEVQALAGEPGVNSARYAGEHCSYEDNNRKLLKKLEGVPDDRRSALFRCVVACCNSLNGPVETAEGAIEGQILTAPRGQNGFGYDPLFYLPQFKKTLAELSPEEKNRVSHRALAVLKAKEILMRFLAL